MIGLTKRTKKPTMCWMRANIVVRLRYSQAIFGAEQANRRRALVERTVSVASASQPLGQHVHVNRKFGQRHAFIVLDWKRRRECASDAHCEQVGVLSADKCLEKIHSIRLLASAVRVRASPLLMHLVGRFISSNAYAHFWFRFRAFSHQQHRI